jgi:hypothetical protein
VRRTVVVVRAAENFFRTIRRIEKTPLRFLYADAVTRKKFRCGEKSSGRAGPAARLHRKSAKR